MTNINLLTTTSESLESLADRQQEGFSVMRSAHVGNARAYNLAFAEAGVAMLLVDHTITGVDKNYLPEVIVKGGDQWPVAELGQVSFRALVTGDGADGRYLDELHTSSLGMAFPNTLVETNTEYLRRNESIAGEIFKIAAATERDLFRRVIRADESRAVDAPTMAQRFAEQGEVIQLADNPRREQGVLLPNEVDILANFVIELITSGRDTQYHISGPDMVKYMTKPRSRDDSRTPLAIVDALYGVLRSRASFRAQLPEVLTVNLIPGAAAKFVTTARRANELNALLEAVKNTKDEFAMLNKRKGEFFRTTASKDDAARSDFIVASNRVQKEIATTMKQAAECCADLSKGPTDAPYMSQYDVIDEGGLYVPEAIRSSTMAELTALDSDIKTLQRGAP